MSKNTLSDRLSDLITLFDERLLSIARLWREKSIDTRWGGYLCSRDRAFSLTGTDKGAWAQGRQIYTFAAMAEYDSSEKELWVQASRSGADFVVNKMLDQQKRTNYLVDQSGNTVLEGPISIFSDAFAIGGLAKYTHVSKDYQYLPVLQALFDTYSANVFDGDFKDIVPYAYTPGVLHHAVFMIALNTAMSARLVLGKEKTDSVIKKCLSIILERIYDKESGLLYERKTEDGKVVNDENGRFVNVGHVFESMWFCLDAALGLGESRYIDRIITIAENTFARANDQGLPLFSFNPDADTNQREHKTWQYESTFGGSDKVSWVFAETMVLFAKLYTHTEDQKYLDRLEIISTYVEKYFWDHEHGDWFHALDADGNVTEDFKGSTVKNAYHIPRAYLEMIGTLTEAKRRLHA